MRARRAICFLWLLPETKEPLFPGGRHEVRAEGLRQIVELAPCGAVIETFGLVNEPDLMPPGVDVELDAIRYFPDSK